MTGTGSSPDEGIASQRQRLVSLESCEERIRDLRDRECDLEVEHIAAEAALHSAAERFKPGIDPALAARLGRSLEHRRELEERRPGAGPERGSRKTGGSRERDALRAGHAALIAWLDASKPEEPGALARAAKIALLIATVVTLWAAYAIHPAFLVLLVVVVGPVSFALGRGQDAEWRRVGARRRFDTSGLADIAAWDEQTVRARAAELEALLEKTDKTDEADQGEPDEHAAIASVDSADERALAAQIVETEERLASDLAAAGLTMDDTRGQTGEWLRLVARAERSRESLERIKSERRRLREEASELRDQLQRYLQARGVKPTEQQDTARAIADRLDSLSDSD